MTHEDADLIYSAVNRCPCGEGLAYAKGMKEWHCSGLLTGRAIPEGEFGWRPHIEPLPFSEFEVLSEKSKKAGGMTTRPRRR